MNNPKSRKKINPSPLNLVCMGKIQEVDWKNITWQELTETKEHGPIFGNILHHIISIYGATDVEKAIRQIPKELLTKELLSQKTKYNESVFFSMVSAAVDLNSLKLPKESITKEMLLEPTTEGQTALYVLIKYNEVDALKPYLNDETLLLKSCEMSMATYLHQCAGCDLLEKIPKEIWTKHLGLKDANGNNLIHWMAKSFFDQYPITPEIMKLINEKNKEGQTPLHKAGDLNKFPKQYLTKENLAVKDQEGDTPLHTSAKIGSAHWLPLKLLTEKALLIENKAKETPLYLLSMSYENVHDRKITEKLLKILSDKTLSNMKTWYLRDNLDSVVRNELVERKLKKELKEEESINL